MGLKPGFHGIDIRPKLLTAVKGYTWAKFFKDLVAGLTVGLVALPLAMAFAISSGVPPQSGIYCAIFAGFIISALGGSMTQIGGPTGAFVVVVSGIVQKYGIDGLFMCTLLAGVMLILLGITGLGTAVKFIPRPVVIGFTNGIAVLIASTQIKDFFGLTLEKVPGEFLPRMQALAQSAPTWVPIAFGFSAASLALILLFNRYLPKVPGAVAALFIGTGIAWGFNLPLETIDSRFGGIPAGLPAFHIPSLRPELILPLLAAALTVTMLGAIESLLSAVVADRMTGDEHNPNAELFAQGVANVVSPLFGGLPATGAIARTATNIRSGAQSPVAGMIHALTLLFVLLVAAPLAKHIPLTVLAAILLVVAYNMGEWKEIPSILKMGKADIAVWIITFVLTVVADLTVAVQAGMILAALLYIQKVTSTTTVTEVTEEDREEGAVHNLSGVDLPDEVSLFRIHGPFLFGSTDKLKAVTEHPEDLGHVVALRLRNMNAIDATGIHALEDLAKRLKKEGRTLILCGARTQPARLIQQSNLPKLLGTENIVPHVQAAIARAKVILAKEPE